MLLAINYVVVNFEYGWEIHALLALNRE